MNSFIHSEITQKIIGCAIKVHNTLGAGFQEVIYQRSLAIEMKKQQLLFKRELEIKIYYDNIEVGTRRVDFLVDNKVIIELKALSALDDIHLAQTLNYLEASKLEVGLLINFGTTKLQFKRLIKSQRIAI
jgi:GxxExxY protein